MSRSPSLSESHHSQHSIPHQPSLFDAAYHAGETRAAAFERSKPKQSERQAKVLAFFAERGMRGGTREECADALAIPLQSICSVILGLRRCGALIETPERRPTRSGSPAVVLVVRGVER